MTSAYTKRAKGNWNQGKSCKGDSSERAYAKREIQEMIKECDQDYLTRYRKGKRTRNEKARLLHQIDWYQQAIDGDRNAGDWRKSFLNYCRDALKKAQKEYKEKYGTSDE